MKKLLQASLALLLSTAGAVAVAPPTKGGAITEGPIKGVVVGNAVLGCFLEEKWAVNVYVCPLDKDVGLRGLRCGLSDWEPDRPDIGPVRWHVGHGAFWISADLGLLPRSKQGAGLARFDLPSLFDGNVVDFPGFPRWLAGGNEFADDSAATRVRNRGYSVVTDDDFTVHYDFLPVGKLQVLQFVLTDVPLKGRRRPRAGDEKGEAPKADKKAERWPWSLTVYRYEGRWSGKGGERWEMERPWTREGTIPVAFTEPFQVLGKGDDFYFVTRSGQLFVAKKLPKGKERTLLRLWSDPARPIEALITDANSDRTFLFVGPPKAGGKPAFFELSDRLRLESYDPGLVVPAKEGPERLRRVVNYARVLAAYKKIKVTPGKK